MFLKMMSAENIPDSDSRKTYELLDHIESAKFRREKEGRAVVDVVYIGDWETVQMYPEGNCYLMNDNGKTIATFGVWRD